MPNVTEGISLPLQNIIKYYNMEKFRYDDYLVITAFKLLLFIIMVEN